MKTCTQIEKKPGGVAPMKLKQTASAIARQNGASGAIVIVVGDNGVRAGCKGLSPEAAREALCLVIYDTYVSVRNVEEEVRS